MRILLAAPLLAAGCLSAPTGLTPDATPAHAWPPAGTTLDITAGTVVDLDHDGFDDLVLSSGGPTPSLYVLRGGADFGTTYASSMVTTDPLIDLVAADLDGDQKPELVAISSPATSTGRLSLFHALTPVTWATPWTKDYTDIPPDPTAPDTHNFVRVLPVAADTTAILIASSMGVDVGTLATPDAAGVATFVANPVPFPASSDAPNGAFLVDQNGGKALIVDTYFYTLVYQHIESASPTSTTECADGGVCGSFANNAFVSTLCDVNGDGVPDSLGGGDTWSALTLPGLGLLQLDPMYVASGPALRMLCGDLDAVHSSPDAAVLEDMTGSTRLSVIENLHLDTQNSGYITNSGKHSTDLTGAPVHVLVEGDFDHDGRQELVTVDEAGHVSRFHDDPTGLTKF